MFDTREAWLYAAAGELIPRVAAASGRPEPEKLAVIASWPSTGPRSNTVGECYAPAWTPDGTIYVMITPSLGDDPAHVLEVLLHELVHSFGYRGHKRDFAEVARAVGLLRPWTATTASEPLRADLMRVAENLGPYPHIVLRTPLRGSGRRWRPTWDKPEVGEPKLGRTPSGRKLYPTYVSPVEPGYTTVMSPTRIKRWGAPICPISMQPMVLAEKDRAAWEDELGEAVR